MARCRSWISGPISVAGSSGWPTFSLPTRSATRGENCSAMLVLHQQARGGRAALAVQRVDHEHHGIERAVEVGVVEHDDGVLAAELEVHALQGGRALAHDGRAGGALADEADGLDVGMLGQRLAGFLAEAVHRVHDAGGQAGLVHQAHQQIGGDGRPLGRLVHDRAAGGQGRRDLPGREHERRVPRRDDADRADRHARRHVPVVGGRQVEAVAGVRPRGRRRSGSSRPSGRPPST